MVRIHLRDDSSRANGSGGTNRQICATTCHLWLKKGAEGISEPDDDELDRMETAADLQLDSRLGCQAVITGPGTYVVEIPSWNRNYVSEGKPLALAESKS